ncbi:MAG: hypothetical protein ABSE16_05220 [Verrucomicrobiota bacterium]|jgi:hypothetical protein
MNLVELLDPQTPPRSEILANIYSTHKTAKARHAALAQNYERALTQALQKDARERQPVFASNTYSGTLVTSFLMDGSVTPLQNKWAFLRAYSIAKDTDPYKPLATGELKYTTGGEPTQIAGTAPTTFEPATGSTVGAITIVPQWFNQPMRVSANDLNSGLRLDDLREKNLAMFADAVTVAATAPITAANFSAQTPLIQTFGGFGFSDLATLQGQLQKSPIKNAILNGNYLARILNQPGFFQKTGTDMEDAGGYQAFGWNGIYEASNWTGAGNNVNGFACNPQAIVRATGLPLNPTNIPGGTLNSTMLDLPALGIAVQFNLWFSLSTRTLFASWDLIAGFAAGDTTAGVVVAVGTPS